jgi:hypothetical protein
MSPAALRFLKHDQIVELIDRGLGWEDLCQRCPVRRQMPQQYRRQLLRFIEERSENKQVQRTGAAG